MTREELLAHIWEAFIRLTDEQVAQLMEFIKEECGDDEPALKGGGNDG